MTNDPVRLVKRFFTDMLSPGNWSIAGEILDPSVVMHHPASLEPIAGSDAVQAVLAGFRAGFPDLNITVLDAFGDGDKAVARWQMTGTNTASLFGAPPTGKAVVVGGISIVRAAGGLIVEDWVSEDTAGLMRQLSADAKV
jgi:predicted ester cyclase